VLDLRSNGGGDAQAMADVGAAFFSQSLNLGSFTDRVGISFVLQTRSLSALPPPKQTRLPMVVLVNEGTSSAAEILAAVLQKSTRARVVGTQTCGCVLAIRNRHELPDGGVLDVSELDYRTAEGLRLEGTGVTPDNIVTFSRSDLYKGRDAALKYAVGLLPK
jgi:carboxyl-terminal processing protease